MRRIKLAALLVILASCGKIPNSPPLVSPVKNLNAGDEAPVVQISGGDFVQTEGGAATPTHTIKYFGSLGNK